MCSTPAPPLTDEPAVQRLVAGAAAGHQSDLPGRRAAGPQDDLVLDVHGEGRVRGGDPRERVGHHGVRAVDELLH
jgi:hypothetical protein